MKYKPRKPTPRKPRRGLKNLRLYITADGQRIVELSGVELLGLAEFTTAGFSLVRRDGIVDAANPVIRPGAEIDIRVEAVP